VNDVEEAIERGKEKKKITKIWASLSKEIEKKQIVRFN
jgi:hypothetical protein